MLNPYSYLLVLGSTDMGSISIGSSAGNITKFTPELVLSIACQHTSTTRTAAAILGNLQCRFLLFVFLAFQVLLVSLMQSMVGGRGTIITFTIYCN